MTDQEAMKVLVEEWMDEYTLWMKWLKEGDTPVEALSLLESFA